MPKDSGVPAPGGEAALRLLAAALAPHLRQHFKPNEAQAGYYSQHDSPLGRARHLELARRGTLPANKIGRRVLVARDRVHAYIEAHGAARRVEPTEDKDLLADWGLTGRSGRCLSSTAWPCVEVPASRPGRFDIPSSIREIGPPADTQRTGPVLPRHRVTGWRHP
jgi:excisionase family DNA binding protein